VKRALGKNNSYLMNSPEKEKFDRLIKLLLRMWLIGFDELEMEDRTEAVELFGERIKQGVQDFNRRLTTLEERVHYLEQQKMN